jgi:hypothetical protein
MTSNRKPCTATCQSKEALEFEYRIMGYRGRGYEELPTSASTQATYSTTKRCVAQAEGTSQTEIWPGIDVDISTCPIKLQPLPPHRSWKE